MNYVKQLSFVIFISVSSTTFCRGNDLWIQIKTSASRNPDMALLAGAVLLVGADAVLTKWCPTYCENIGTPVKNWVTNWIKRIKTGDRTAQITTVGVLSTLLAAEIFYRRGLFARLRSPIEPLPPTPTPVVPEPVVPRPEPEPIVVPRPGPVVPGPYPAPRPYPAPPVNPGPPPVVPPYVYPPHPMPMAVPAAA